ncbi:MarR family winged helix-turn-helix transcriptional regulator [Amorphoplanes digitatis]|uniref:DNA-binding MarR family transcriptional regulator n=1 Tax=Actinoplanes digitatis TaxID=1868 RepID=A0A7W7MMG3_9ACTN|nr:MarR family winged helix-turn-helix transcriptional regulator [Actinoplanes digitatis]MBB4759908.1 DNA-binding MarR family transcriptional regulator [Actinoplanes digitatis]GID96457.1 MarR family transcriptional regulator [Actinoplanes digitatis]
MSAVPPVPLSGEEQAVMRAFGRLIQVLPRLLDADLERDQRMSLSEYTALRHLSEAEDRLMRMSELAAACDMSLSGMTRLASKLESLGYLRRIRCERDARGSNAVLTDAGLARLREAWPDHLASVRRHIFDHLEGMDLRRFAAALEAMTGSAGPACNGDPHDD